MKYLTSKEHGYFLKELSMLYSNGINIIQALNMIRNRTKIKKLGRAIDNIILNLNDGLTLYESFNKNNKIFDGLMIYMLLIAEESGQLDYILKELQEYYYFKSKLKSKIVSQIAYPITLFITMIIVVNILFISIIPGFETMLSNYESISKSSNLIFQISHIASNHWRLIVNMELVLGSLILYFCVSKRFENFKNNIFPINIFYKSIYKIYFYQTLSMLISSGVSINKSIWILTEISKNTPIEKNVSKMNENFQYSASVSDSMKISKLCSDICYQLISSGEESGNLDNILMKCYKIMQESFEDKLKKILALIAPTSIIFLASIILSVLTSVLTPMFEVINNI